MCSCFVLFFLFSLWFWFYSCMWCGTCILRELAGMQLMCFPSWLPQSILYYPQQLGYFSMINDSNKPLCRFREKVGPLCLSASRYSHGKSTQLICMSLNTISVIWKNRRKCRNLVLSLEAPWFCMLSYWPVTFERDRVSCRLAASVGSRGDWNAILEAILPLISITWIPQRLKHHRS